DEIVPLEIDETHYADGDLVQVATTFAVDEGPRPDTSMEALSKLRPAFRNGGTVTAGNSSQTSDGRAAAVVMRERRMHEPGAQPMGRILGFSVAGVRPEIMGIGPVDASAQALRQSGRSLKDIGLIELNEAFAAQALAVIREAGLDESITNVNGGAIALGHPL